MESSAKMNRLQRRLAVMAGILLPGIATAHGSDHLHFWGQHTSEGQVVLLSLTLLAGFGIVWWLWRSRGQ